MKEVFRQFLFTVNTNADRYVYPASHPLAWPPIIPYPT